MNKILTIKDHRTLNSVDYLNPSNYLLSIGQLVYHINVDKKVYKPIYKSDDLCGKVSTIVHHAKLGKITICGGNNQLTVFQTNSDGNIDLSTPKKNVYIDPIIQNELKSLKIMSLVSSRAHPNHFGLISEIKDLAGGETVSPGIGNQHS